MVNFSDVLQRFPPALLLDAIPSSAAYSAALSALLSTTVESLAMLAPFFPREVRWCLMEMRRRGKTVPAGLMEKLQKKFHKGPDSGRNIWL